MNKPVERWADKARRQGHEARLEGRPVLSNPYPYGGTLYRLWREGWTAEDNALRHVDETLLTTLSEPSPLDFHNGVHVETASVRNNK